MSTTLPAFTTRPLETADSEQTILCFSHLRWNFDFDRPHQLMSRLASQRRVIYWEEPELAPPDCEPALGVRECAETGVTVVMPSIPEGMTASERNATLRNLLDKFLAGVPGPYVRWYHTSRMLPFSQHVPGAVIYDCIDDAARPSLRWSHKPAADQPPAGGVPGAASSMSTTSRQPSARFCQMRT